MECMCGCGELVGREQKFRPGHDQKLRVALDRNAVFVRLIHRAPSARFWQSVRTVVQGLLVVRPMQEVGDQDDDELCGHLFLDKQVDHPADDPLGPAVHTMSVQDRDVGPIQMGLRRHPATVPVGHIIDEARVAAVPGEHEGRHRHREIAGPSIDIPGFVVEDDERARVGVPGAGVRGPTVSASWGAALPCNSRRPTAGRC